jgi:bifunctional enzyme CysN/CysC
MSSASATQREIDQFLERHQNKELLRFVAVGSVDDGKSTLIGRLLHDTHGVYDDQLKAVKRASVRSGLEIDFSLFTDGLKAEREQGITIDVAYRYFTTDQRKFIIADTPGHVQYTRNMATGASTANVAVILIDARLGVLQQSRRHAYIAALLGIPHLAVCVNKMDLIDYDRRAFEHIRFEFEGFARRLGFKDVVYFPVSALAGDNVVHPSSAMPWYSGPSLLRHLETVPIAVDRNFDDFRFPVQYVMRPDLDYRGFAGQVASGVVHQGDEVLVLPSRRTTRIAAIDTFDGELAEAYPPMSVTLRLADEIDISRGDMIVHPGNEPEVATHFDAMLVWMSEKPLDRQSSYFLKQTTRMVRAEVEDVAFTKNLETLEDAPAERLELNDIGRVTIGCHTPLFFDAYTKNRATGAFILIDALTNNTVAAGMILGASARDDGDRPSQRSIPHSQVPPDERRELLGQWGATVWLTGLPASGKSEIAFALERLLFNRGRLAIVVDPDDGLSSRGRPDGSSPRFTPEMARRMTDSGVIAIFAFASPLRADRIAVREAVGAERFLEVHVATPVDECVERDTRGAYDQAHAAPSYEPPRVADSIVSLADENAEEAAERIYALLQERQFFDRE